MNWIWLDATTPDRACAPDYPKSVKNRIDGHFWPLFDPQTTKANLQANAAQGYYVGVYMASNWTPFVGKTGAQIAEIVHAEVQKLRFGTGPSKPKVQFDLEEHNPEKIASCFERWRELQPTRDTSWTMEGMQGGWMGPVIVSGAAPKPGSFVARILACRIRLFPQSYDAVMNRWAEAEVLRDLLKRGFPQEVVSMFLDAAQLAPWWQGLAFTQQRLPG